jgi:hypothetical protein
MCNRRLVGAVIVALLALTLGSHAAFASEVNVATDAGFGPQVGSTLGPATFSSLDWTATLTESVFLSGGVYTYVFTVANITRRGNAGSTLEQLFTASTAFGDNFSSTLDWGEVTGLSTSGVTSFSFGGSLEVGLAGLAPGHQSTFYAQSTGSPTAGTLAALDNIFGSTASLDPGPEPRSVLLFGTGLLAFGIVLRRRQAVQS